jgi:hypothetical protein
MNWVAGNTQQQSLRTSQAAGETVNMKMVWPTSPETTAVFDLVLLSFEMGETTPESQLTASASGRISGAITWG